MRRSGAGGKTVVSHEPRLPQALDEMIEGDTRGDPESPLRWISKSTRTIGRALTEQRYRISHVKVAQLLHEQHYSLQGDRKTEEGRIIRIGMRSSGTSAPRSRSTCANSVDTKKKERIGNFENKGRQGLPAKQPLHVEGHDLPQPQVPRAYPYGI